MAQAVFNVSLDVVEKAWIGKALVVLRQTLIRSRSKEIVGTEIYTLRGKEIESLNVLVQKFT